MCKIVHKNYVWAQFTLELERTFGLVLLKTWVSNASSTIKSVGCVGNASEAVEMQAACTRPDCELRSQLTSLCAPKGTLLSHTLWLSSQRYKKLTKEWSVEASNNCRKTSAYSFTIHFGSEGNYQNGFRPIVAQSRRHTTEKKRLGTNSSTITWGNAANSTLLNRKKGTHSVRNYMTN